MPQVDFAATLGFGLKVRDIPPEPRTLTTMTLAPFKSSEAKYQACPNGTNLQTYNSSVSCH